jgi:hypothetical protein
VNLRRLIDSHACLGYAGIRDGDATGRLVKLVPKQERAGFAIAWALPPEIA